MRKWSCFSWRTRRRAPEPSHVSCLSPAPGSPERTPRDPFLIDPQEHSGGARRDTGVLGTGGMDLAHTSLPGYPDRQPHWLRCLQPCTASWFSFDTSKGALPLLRYLPCLLMAQNTVQTHQALLKPPLMRPDFHCVPDDASCSLAACSRPLRPVTHTGITLWSHALPFPSQVTFQCLVQGAGRCVLSSLVEWIAASFDSQSLGPWRQSRARAGGRHFPVIWTEES